MTYIINKELLPINKKGADDPLQRTQWGKWSQMYKGKSIEEMCLTHKHMGKCSTVMIIKKLKLKGNKLSFACRQT